MARGLSAVFLVLILLLTSLSLVVLSVNKGGLNTSLNNEVSPMEVIVPLAQANIAGFQEGSIYTNTTLSAGTGHTCAILDNGSVSCWGGSNQGQLGNGGTLHKLTPTSTNSLGAGRTAVAVSSGDLHTCAILDNGSVSCWGAGYNGRLGNGGTSNQLTPTLTSSLGAGRTAVAISPGDRHTCAILDNGSVSCWGMGSNGRLGNGGTSTQLTPTLTSNLGAGRTAVALSSGQFHTCAILDNGSVSCWGIGSLGRLGNGGISDQLTPTYTNSLGAGRSAVALSSGYSHTCAILDNGLVSCWGAGSDGQLGNGGTSDKTTPTLTSSLGTGRTAVALSSGQSHTCAILDNGLVSCWGKGGNGRLGNGGTSDKTTPTLTSSLGAGRTAVALSSGGYITCAILDSGSVSCWGKGINGLLGNGGTSDETTPTLTSSFGAGRTVAVSERDLDDDGILNIFDSTPYPSNNQTTITELSNWTISPSSGPSEGGTELTITGNGFYSLLVDEEISELPEPAWELTEVENHQVEMDTLTHSSLVLDSSGNPHISYYDTENGDLKYATKENGIWQNYTIDSTGDVGMYSSIGIDSNDTIHFSYFGGSNPHLKYAHRDVDGNIASYSINYDLNSVQGSHASLDIDDQNRAHIVYYDETDMDLSYVVISNYGQSWTDTVILDEPEYSGDGQDCCVGSMNSQIKFELDSNNVPHIFFVDGLARASGGHIYGTIWNGNWTFEDIGSADGAESDSIDLAIGPNNSVHVVYISNQNSKAVHAYLSSNSEIGQDSWVSTEFVQNENEAIYIAIDIDSSNNTHIIHSDDYNLNQLIHRVYDSNLSNISYTIVDSVLGRYNSLVSDDAGNLHVAYCKSNVLKYGFMNFNLTNSNRIEVQFSNYGTFTGTVVNNTTIRVTTPPGLTGDTVNLTLWSANGSGYVLTSAFSYLLDSNPDTDGDGIDNELDDCPNSAGSSTLDQIGCPDSDGDGYSDSGDLFPLDSGEWADSDGDGVGNNGDTFPNDANETTDSDGDGVGNNGDAFPNDANETTDSDGDGIGDNSDAFPNYGGESVDTDGDGVGDNSDEFPDDVNESVDSDGDGIGDNEDEYPFINNFIDSDGDEIPDLFDDFINDPTQWSDYDGDGYGDLSEGNNSDAFINNASQWSDTDGDGYGDNWGSPSWNQTRLFIWPGQFVENAVLADHCPTEFGNSTADGYFGCLDIDGDGIADIYDDLILNENENQSNETNVTETVDSDGDGVEDLLDLCPNTVLGGYVDIDGCLFDQDGDGVDDLKDACPNTQFGISVNVNGCAVIVDDERSFFESFSSGEQAAVLQTVGVGAVLIALFGFLQTNMVAALLPDSLRWIRVWKGNSKLNKEEIRELEYLKSLVQTYYQDHEMLKDELYQLKSELTARYTNSDIKKITREKLNTLISDLIAMEPAELNRIAHNDAFFGLGGALSTKERGEYLEQDALMRFDDNVFDLERESESTQTLSSHPSKEVKGQVNETDGHEYLEHPSGSDSWYYRNHSNGEWVRWDN